MDGQTKLFNALIAVNQSFFDLPALSLAERRIFEGVMLLDEYRLYDHWSKQLPIKHVFDVGGHCGSFTRMVKCIWPNASITAYEPTEALAKRFRDNVSLLSSIKFHQSVATSRNDIRVADGHIPFWECDHENTGGNTTTERDDGRRQLVASRCLIDDIVATGIDNVSLLKLDCEGDEGPLLQDLGDANLVRHIPYICGEWHGENNAIAVERLLSRTHHVEVCRGSHPLGAFFANRRTSP